MNGSGLAILGLTVPIMLAIGAGIFKVSGLRGTIYRDWHVRIDRLLSGVDEFAFQKLRQLYEAIGPWLYVDHGFWPDGPPPHPESLSSLVAHYSRAVRYGKRLERDVQFMMWVGPITTVALALGLIPMAIVTLLGVGVLEDGLFIVLAYSTGAVALFGTVLALGSFVVLRHRVTSVEVLAGKGESCA